MKQLVVLDLERIAASGEHNLPNTIARASSAWLEHGFIHAQPDAFGFRESEEPMPQPTYGRWLCAGTKRKIVHIQPPKADIKTLMRRAETFELVKGVDWFEVRDEESALLAIGFAPLDADLVRRLSKGMPYLNMGPRK